MRKSVIFLVIGIFVFLSEGIFASSSLVEKYELQWKRILYGKTTN